MKDRLKQIMDEAMAQIDSSDKLDKLNEIKVSFLGKKGELTSINLKIYHNSSQMGKVTVTMDTDTLGKVAADFDISEEKISGMIAYDKKTSGQDIKILQDNLQEQFSKAQQESGQNKKISISLAETKTLDLNRFGQDRDVEESEKLSTRELYQTAKAFITALKSLDQQYEA